MQVYDFRTYVIEKKGINVSIVDLVENGYYDKRCDYTKNEKACRVPKTCVIKVGIDYDTAVNDSYYVVKGYTAELFSGC